MCAHTSALCSAQGPFPCVRGPHGLERASGRQPISLRAHDTRPDSTQRYKRGEKNAARSGHSLSPQAGGEHGTHMISAHISAQLSGLSTERGRTRTTRRAMPRDAQRTPHSTDGSRPSVHEVSYRPVCLLTRANTPSSTSAPSPALQSAMCLSSVSVVSHCQFQSSARPPTPHFQPSPHASSLTPSPPVASS